MNVVFISFLFTVTAGVVNPFFAMDTGTADEGHVSVESQAALVKSVGFDGFGSTGFGNVPQVLRAMDAQGLKLFTIYSHADVEPDGFSYEAGFKEALPLLKGRDAIVWLPISSNKYALSSPEGDGQAVAMLREMADAAAPFGVRIALYPHTAMWLEKVEDAVRVADKVDRPNVGVTFNLCHWLNAGKGENMKPLLRQALARLMVVTINGADAAGTDWTRLIQPLGDGAFDVAGFVVYLNSIGYKGPVGLQHFGIKGDAEVNLRKSMAAWREIRPE